MLFNSFEFLVFFTVVSVSYFLIPARSRWVLLLAASYVFYMYWKAEYALLILFSTIVDYAAAIAMERTEHLRARKALLAASLAANLGLLFFFKYFNLFSDTAASLLSAGGLSVQAPTLRLLLPVGISFYTFQTLSYSIDVYRGERRAETHFGRFALYVAFFPQLVAGPIERSTRLLPQFQEPKQFDYARVVSGLRLMVWGLFKKVVVADRLAVLVDTVYAGPGDFTGLPILIATYAFAFQIYCDFSGYSDMAVGAARVLGFSLMENFDRPYAADSVQDFWRRWHISLSTWFRDYLYFPLGGNRTSGPRWIANLFIVFLLSGLWHGAAWTFAIWGALHGSFLIISKLTMGMRRRLTAAIGLTGGRFHRAIRVMVTFHLTCFAWIFFRADSFQAAVAILKSLAGGFQLRLSGYGMGLPRWEILLSVVCIALIEGVQELRRRGLLTPALMKYHRLRWGCYYAAAGVIFLFGKFGGYEFIYFQF